MDIVKTAGLQLITACVLNAVMLLSGCSDKAEGRSAKCAEHDVLSVDSVNSLLKGCYETNEIACVKLVERLHGITDDNSRLAATRVVCNALLQLPNAECDMVNAVKGLRMRNNLFCEAVKSAWQTSKDESAVFDQWRRWHVWNSKLFEWLSERRRVIDQEYRLVRKESLDLQFKLTRVAISDLSSSDRERLNKCRAREADLVERSVEWSRLASIFNSTADMTGFRELGKLLLKEKSASATQEELRLLEVSVDELTKWRDEWHLDENCAMPVLTSP